jgi:hypothetical protein
MLTTDFNTTIRTLSTTDEAVQSKGLISFLDSVAPSMDITSELKNPKTAFKTLRAFDKANTYICPEQPTCAGLIDMSYYCANGIEADINIKNVEFCDRPYTFGLFQDDTIAQDLPANGVFADMSGALASAARKECMTIAPKFRYTFYETDGRMCANNAPCGSIIDNLVGSIATKQIRKFREVILATANAVAITKTPTGDILDMMQDVYNELSELPDNQGKEVIAYVNRAVISRLKQLRDNQARPLFESEDVCPITGCITICIGGMKIKSVDDLHAPITVTGGGVNPVVKTTSVLFVVPKNIFAIKSETKIAELGWDQLLTNMNNKIMSIQANEAKIPTVWATSTAMKATITL